jgi:hypothetical protein
MKKSEIKDSIKETNPPRELAIEESKHKFYEELKNGKYLPELKGYEMAHLFIIALAYGVHYNIRKPIIKTKRSISRNYVEKNFEWIVNAVAISESKEDLMVFPDRMKVFQIAEEFANGGISIIEKELKKINPGDFEIDMEKEIKKIINQ